MIKITVEDTETGETATRELDNDVVVIVAGNHYIANVVRHGNGTLIYTIKVEK